MLLLPAPSSRPHRIRSACAPNARDSAHTARQKRRRQITLLRHLVQRTAQTLHRLDWAALSAGERRQVGAALPPLINALVLARTITTPPGAAGRGTPGETKGYGAMKAHGRRKPTVPEGSVRSHQAQRMEGRRHHRKP